MSGTNSYTGGTTILGTTVQANNSSVFGSGDVTLDFGTVQTKGSNLTLTNNFILANTINFGGVTGGFLDANGATLRISGNISGPGALEIVNSTLAFNSVILTGTATHIGGTTVCFCATLEIGTASTMGSILGPIDNLGVLRFVNADTSGITTLNNEGGALTVFRNTTDAGTMTIENKFDPFFGPSTLRFRDSASANEATINNTPTRFRHSAVSSCSTTTPRPANRRSTIAIVPALASRLSGSMMTAPRAKRQSTMRVSGTSRSTTRPPRGPPRSITTIPASLIFNNRSSADNATIVNNANGFFGGIAFNNHSTAVDALMLTTNNGALTLFLDHSDGGNARFETASGGIVDFSGTKGLNNDRKINAGVDRRCGQLFHRPRQYAVDRRGQQYDVRNNNSVGTGKVTLDGGTFLAGANNLTFVNPFAINTSGGAIDTGANTLTVSGAITDGNGPGALTKTGTGTLVLTNSNTYTGGTTISAGTLQLGDGGTAGSILGDVLNNGTFAINRSDMFVFGNVISGTGALQQNGTGMTVLTNTSTYTGATVVNAGGLFVNGSIASSSGLTVNPGGMVGGTGTLPNTTISGGALSPGNSIGTITVNGSLTFVGPGNYIVEVSPSAADRTNVTGTATLAGSVNAFFAPGLYTQTHYTILSATGGLSGTFGGLNTTNLPAFLSASLELHHD